MTSAPLRLDLNKVLARRARVPGVLLAINIDAHALDQLDANWLGIATARRAGVGPAEVVKTCLADKR